MSVNVAVAVLAASAVSVHVPVGFVHAPDQPLNAQPGSGVPVRVTEAPVANDAEQALPQAMKPSPLATVPFPTFAAVTTTRPAQAFAGEARLRGFGAPAVKSAAF